ncbi:MAG: GntG family PLP-dependent aldolase [Ferruginibacter sp.]
MITDLRSDTFTKPSSEMLSAMMNAHTGDDVFGEDPTVNLLESMLCGIFGMEAAVFCPSGTMTNQIAIKCHTQPGEEVICDASNHIYIYEGGGIAFNSGCQVKAIKGERGKITAGQVKESINPDDIHRSKTSLVSVENTANRGGGSCYELSDLQEIKEVCLQNNLKFHLDGARLWNALIAKEEDPKMYGEMFDSISVCMSKGMGAPVGSVLLGNKEFIHKGRRIRKVLGGGMRQAGYLAAAGIYALQNNFQRLQEDHTHAKNIAAALIKKPFIGRMLPVETNILIFDVKETETPASFCNTLKDNDILCLPISPTQVRMVTHLDVTPSMVNKLIELIEIM